MTDSNESTTQEPILSTSNNEAPIERVNNEPAKVKKLKKYHADLSKIHGELEKLIDSMMHNPSMFSRASNYWSGLSWWKKIIAGVVLIAPLLVAAIITQIIVCYVITAFIAAIYVGTSVMLDDHGSHTKHSTQNIKNGVTSLAQGLSLIMESLEEIKESLAEQVKIFTKENEHFGENVEHLKKSNQSLVQEVVALKETEHMLRKTQIELETSCETLKQAVTTQDKLLEETQIALNKVRTDYEQNQKLLEDKTLELKDITGEFQKSLEQYKLGQKSLQCALEVMTQASTLDETQKLDFGTILEKFNSSLQETSTTFANELIELKGLKKRYEESLKIHETLVRKYGSQTNQMEAMIGEGKRFFSPGFFQAKVPQTSQSPELIMGYAKNS